MKNLFFLGLILLMAGCTASQGSLNMFDPKAAQQTPLQQLTSPLGGTVNIIPQPAPALGHNVDMFN